MSRTAKITLHIGDKKTGKTHDTLEIIRSYILNKKRPVIILSPMQPEYDVFERIEIEDLYHFKSRIVPKQAVRLTDLEDVAEICNLINKYVRNALVVFEDATRYMDANLPRLITNLVYNNRNIGVDLLFTFHGFVTVPNRIMVNADLIILRKTKDDFSDNTVKSKIKPYKVDILQAVEKVAKKNKELAKKHSKPDDPLHGIYYASEVLNF